MADAITGSCLCGAVTYSTNAEPAMAAHCHCVDCRKASGTGHCTHVVFPRPAVSIDGQTRGYDHPADSGNMVTRNFCPNCGCAIFSTNDAMPDLIFMRASSLDLPDRIRPAMTVYASRAAEWDRPAADLPSFPTMPEGGPQQVLADLV